ncbi:G-type lectin S-receptor-like serine/threonine-protein kinase [Vitis vinifera]|uniref:G-type lectin S-receptor-like serine/threonine-protein kinase n=1 Tax=Vitis vinifera TaxID=29760 RepID=A0A438FHJ0_VITVI|nr:G-type lectin S-receptor-like serine/threonine-protein kinase [Vitis vinifera]
MAEITTFLLIFSYLFMAALIPLSIHSQPTHTITPGQNLTDLERMVSANGVFTLDQAAKHNATATLLDSGNLVLTHMINDNGAFKREIVWQSFDHPSDTLLPGMKLAVNLKVGSNRSLTSWLSHEVPAPGAFTLGLDPTVDDSCQVVIWRRGIVIWKSGIWEDNSTHLRIGGIPIMLALLVLLNPILSSGCVEEESKCGKHHRTAFTFMNKCMKRRAEYSDDDPNLGIADCDAKCKENCSCIAYASAHKNGTGCHFGFKIVLPWRGNSWDVTTFLLAGSNYNWISYAIVIIIVPTMLYSVICCSYTKSKIAPGNEIFHDDFVHELDTDGSTSEKTSKKCAELQRFSFSDITVATKNFSSKNKLGEGGFGPVYKGKLSEGQEIAVKRLSRGSVQGLLEFKNEIALISKLQHTNLVKILGYCIDREEKMLIYEYMPNKSLDFFIFGLQSSLH